MKPEHDRTWWVPHHIPIKDGGWLMITVSTLSQVLPPASICALFLLGGPCDTVLTVIAFKQLVNRCQ